MGAGTGETQFPTSCENIVRAATELGDPYQQVGAEQSPCLLARIRAAYICLHFLNTSSKHRWRLSWTSHINKCCPGVFKIRFQSHFHLKVRKNNKKKGNEIVLYSVGGKLGFPVTQAPVCCTKAYSLNIPGLARSRNELKFHKAPPSHDI